MTGIPTPSSRRTACRRRFFRVRKNCAPSKRSARTRCWKFRFDKNFSEKSGEIFIRELARDLGKIHSVCVGADFVFGHRRSGNVALLKKLGAELHFQVHGLAAVALDGQVVSSTRIRETIRAGNFDAASQMLGRPYAICGRVVAGDRIGRQLGFPTANLDAAEFGFAAERRLCRQHAM